MFVTFWGLHIQINHTGAYRPYPFLSIAQRARKGKIMKKYHQIIEGPTGSGKTYHTIKKAMNLGRMAYFAPTGLLAYDSYGQYATLGKDALNAKGVKLPGNRHYFGTYGFFAGLNEYDAIVIDEAQAINGDFDHQCNFIRSAIQNFPGHIFLVTATRTFRKLRNFEIVSLPARKQRRKHKINYDECIARANSGIKTLIICDRIKDFEEYRQALDIPIRAISRNCSESQIIDSIAAYNQGKVSCLLSSNIATSGVNMHCDNLLLDVYIDCEISLAQKLGRLGRFDSSVKATYHILDRIWRGWDVDEQPCLYAAAKKSPKKFSVDLSLRFDSEDEGYRPPEFSAAEIEQIKSRIMQTSPKKGTQKCS